MPKLVLVSIPRAFSHMTDYTITGGACFVSLSRIDIGALADNYHFKTSSDECFCLFYIEFSVFFLCEIPLSQQFESTSPFRVEPQKKHSHSLLFVYYATAHQLRCLALNCSQKRESLLLPRQRTESPPRKRMTCEHRPASSFALSANLWTYILAHCSVPLVSFIVNKIICRLYRLRLLSTLLQCSVLQIARSFCTLQWAH